MKQKWIAKDGNNYKRVVENPVDEDQKNLKAFMADPLADKHEKKVLDQYKKRKHLNVKPVKTYSVTKGPEFALERVKLATSLTADMMRTKAWKEEKFKKFNFEALGEEL